MTIKRELDEYNSLATMAVWSEDSLQPAAPCHSCRVLAELSSCKVYVLSLTTPPRTTKVSDVEWAFGVCDSVDHDGRVTHDSWQWWCYTTNWRFLLGSFKMVSIDFVRLNAMLCCACVSSFISILFTSVDHVSTSLAGTRPTRYVYYLVLPGMCRRRTWPGGIRLTLLWGRHSPALMKCKAGPMYDRCMLLAVMDFRVDVCPR